MTPSEARKVAHNLSWSYPCGDNSRADRKQLEEEITAALLAACAQQREEDARKIDAECERVLGCQTKKPKNLFEECVNTQLRMTTVLLPELAAAIRGEKA